MYRIITIFENASERFLTEEKQSILGGASEITLCGTLAKYLEQEIRYSVYHKYRVDIGRGAIAVHGNTKRNRLIGVKMQCGAPEPAQKERGTQQLIALTGDDPAGGYRLGVWYEISVPYRRVYIEYYGGGKMLNDFFVNF